VEYVLVIGKGPAAANGVVTFDGQGKLEGVDTASVNGQITDRSFKGDYAVTPDCTGNATFFFSGREVVNIYGTNTGCTSTPTSTHPHRLMTTAYIRNSQQL
jgi:hypothetical protein